MLIETVDDNVKRVVIEDEDWRNLFAAFCAAGAWQQMELLPTAEKIKQVAEAAYLQADALLAQRGEGEDDADV